MAEALGPGVKQSFFSPKVTDQIRLEIFASIDMFNFFFFFLFFEGVGRRLTFRDLRFKEKKGGGGEVMDKIKRVHLSFNVSMSCILCI